MILGKYEKNKHKKRRWPWICLIAAAAAVIVLFALFAEWDQPSAGDTRPDAAATADATGTASSETEASLPAPETVIAFPLRLEDGSLEIGSLYQFSGINPDSGNQEGQNTASIELTNLSDSYLAEARITMRLAEGTALSFHITDLPAGSATMAFSSENLPLPSDAVCTEVTCQAVFDDTADLAPDAVSVQAAGTQITLTNISGQDISQIVVYCRNTLGEAYFGGVTYQYTINNLAANETATIDAVDCILGMAEVVRIAVG